MYRAVLLAVVMAVWASPSWATILDQSQEVFTGATTVTDGSVYAQTFTAGLTEQLDSVDLLVGGFEIVDYGYPATVSIVETASGVPSGAILGTLSSVVFDEGWNSVSFLSQNIMLTAGEVYGIQFSTDDPTTNVDPTLAFQANYLAGDVYAGGHLWRNSTGTWNYFGFAGESATPTGDDAAFRTNMVPEPSSTALLVFGCLLLGTWARRRRGA